MNKKIEIGYIGYSLVMFTELLNSPFFDLKLCISEKRKAPQQLENVCNENHIALYQPTTRNEMTAIILALSKSLDFVMYENSIIIDQSVLYNRHIYNFHPGSFINNRGANPIVWSILNGDSFTEMTVHEIDAEIDAGIRIDSRIVPIIECEDTSALKSKLEATIPELLISLYGHILRRCYFEQHLNRYNRRIKESDYTIDLDRDSVEQIIRKTQSQRAYNGAILAINGKNVHIRDISRVKQVGKVLSNDNGKYYIEIRQLLEASI